MENKSTKQLIEAANRKCEMRWKVLAFNPDEDNKLVKEFKDFDCIDCAVAKKREYLEKNPTHVVEVISEFKAQKNESLDKKHIDYLNGRLEHVFDLDGVAKELLGPVKDYMIKHNIKVADYLPYMPNETKRRITYACRRQNRVPSNKYMKDDIFAGFWHGSKEKALLESAQRNEDKEFTIKLITPFGKAKVCSWRAASVNDAVKEFLDANPAYRENKKGAVIAESAQRNEGNFKDDATSLKDAQIKLDRAKDELKEAIAQKDFNRQQRFKSDIKYYEDLIKYIKANPVKESSQKNEALDEHELKAWLKSEHSRALKSIKNMAANDSSSFFKGYATALHEVQRKFGL